MRESVVGIVAHHLKLWREAVKSGELEKAKSMAMAAVAAFDLLLCGEKRNQQEYEEIAKKCATAEHLFSCAGDPPCLRSDS